MPTDLTDEQLVNALARGNRDALNELYSRHALRLRAFLAARTRDLDADEIAQDTWVRFFTHLQKEISPPANFLPYLYAVARNTLNDHRRRLQTSLKSVADSEVADELAYVEGVAEGESEIRDELKRLVSNLPDRQRAIVRMRLEGMSADAIAEELKLARSTVQREWFRITSTLRRQLANEDVPHPHLRIKREIHVLIDPGDAPVSLITDFYVALSSLYSACGGSGLVVSTDERRSFVPEVL